MELEDHINRFLSEKEHALGAVNRWGKDLVRRLQAFTLGGKMIRGGLLVLSSLMFGARPTSSVIQAAAALELVQSSLLIHDDIMDRDYTRRGTSSIFYQYKNTGEKLGQPDPYHFGESMGICAGDIGFFLAFEILSGLDVEPAATQNIIMYWSQELSVVGLAQMQDLSFSQPDQHITEDQVVDLYRYKTARYSFSVPLVTGAMIAGADQSARETLHSLGEKLGVVFQIKDDELGLFGSEAKTGKPVGSDIKEGKKTLYHHYLAEMVPEEELNIIDSIMKRKEITHSDMTSIQKIIIKNGVQDRIHQQITALEEEIRPMINSLEIEDKYRNILLDVLNYSIKRNK
ncbi:MAG: polyprenyl synthetase family protein [Spirochaetota bacterium]